MCVHICACVCVCVCVCVRVCVHVMCACMYMCAVCLLLDVSACARVCVCVCVWCWAETEAEHSHLPRYWHSWSVVAVWRVIWVTQLRPLLMQLLEEELIVLVCHLLSPSVRLSGTLAAAAAAAALVEQFRQFLSGPPCPLQL